MNKLILEARKIPSKRNISYGHLKTWQSKIFHFISWLRHNQYGEPDQNHFETNSWIELSRSNGFGSWIEPELGPLLKSPLLESRLKWIGSHQFESSILNQNWIENILNHIIFSTNVIKSVRQSLSQMTISSNQEQSLTL